MNTRHKIYHEINLFCFHLRGTFFTIFKKGRKDDYGNYRLIDLLNHSYKVLSSLLNHPPGIA